MGNSVNKETLYEAINQGKNRQVEQLIQVSRKRIYIYVDFSRPIQFILIYVPPAHF